MTLSLSKTRPLRQLLSRIGRSTYRFNTILVGLDCIAKGEGDGGSIAVTWTKPKGAQEAKNAADQARIFACSGAIVLASDVFDTFLRDFANEPWLNVSSSVKDIATKAKTRPKEEGGAYSVAERATALANDLDISDVRSVALIELLSKWRNVVAHDSGRLPWLEPNLREELLCRQIEISENFSHLSVAEAVHNFEARRVPVSKEVTSLMANAVRFARSIDEAAIRRAASNRQDIESVAEHLLARYFAEIGTGKANAQIADVLQGKRARRVASLIKLLSSVGISNTSTPVSASLGDDFISSLAAMSHEQFARRFSAG